MIWRRVERSKASKNPRRRHGREKANALAAEEGKRDGMGVRVRENKTSTKTEVSNKRLSLWERR